MVIELAAQRMLIMSQGGLYAVAPAELYECYNKLNRRVTAELLAVDVAEFLSQVPDSSDQELAALYDQGKNRFPFPTLVGTGVQAADGDRLRLLQGSVRRLPAREMAVIRPTITDEEVDEILRRQQGHRVQGPGAPGGGTREDDTRGRRAGHAGGQGGNDARNRSACRRRQDRGQAGHCSRRTPCRPRNPPRALHLLRVPSRPRPSLPRPSRPRPSRPRPSRLRPNHPRASLPSLGTLRRSRRSRPRLANRRRPPRQPNWKVPYCRPAPKIAPAGDNRHVGTSRR